MVGMLIVCIISFLLIGFAIHVLRENGEDMEKINEFSGKHAFTTTDSTPDIEVSRILSQENASELLSKFFLSLYDDEISFTTDYGYDMYHDEKGNIVRYHTVADAFFELFGITAEKGRLFTKEEYETASDVVPVVIGYELRDSFKLGQEYFFENPTGGGGFQGRIVGVLGKNSEYYRICNVGVNESLDTSYIVPFTKAMCTANRAISDYDMALSGLTVFLDDPADAEKINRRISDMNLFRYKLKDVDKAADEALENQQKGIVVVSVIFAVIVVVVFVTTFLIFRKIIRTHAVEIGVRVLCGASVSKIASEIAGVAGVLVAISLIPGMLMTETWKDALICLGCAAVLFALIVLIPVRMIRRLSVVEIVRNPNME